MSKIKILVVEDDVALVKGIQDILQLEGYEVETATSGKEGLERLKNAESPPDLIVSDIMMPQMGGYEFFKEVRRNPDWLMVPFIFLTARGERTDVLFGKKLGVDDYLVKPFDPEELTITVEAKLRRHNQIQDVQNDIMDSAMDDLKRKILTIINHEFRTPLTYVVAYSDMLGSSAPDELAPEDFQSFLKGIQTGSDRLRDMIEKFIFLVEFQTGEAAKTFQWRKRRFDMFDDIINEVLETKQSFAEERDITIKVEQPDNIPEIEADAEYLKNALLQLIDNAIKFSNPGGRVTLRIESDDENVYFRVIDEGIGIPEEAYNNLFRAFYQFDRERLEQQGAGTGLAIVKGIAEVHGGEILIESEVDEGSTFTLAIPIAPTEVEEEEAQQETIG
jgi:signal transduction histidine kinase